MDKVNDSFVISAQLTATGDRLLLLHDALKNDEPVRAFFLEALEHYLRFTLNPFYANGTSLQGNTAFSQRIQSTARKYLDK